MVFSYYYEGSNAFSSLSRLIFEAIEQGEVNAVASSFTLAEMLTGIAQAGDLQAKQTYIDLITSFPNLTFVPFDNMTANRFADVRASTNLRPSDAIHIATAQTANADLLISNDYTWRGRFAKPKLILLGDYL
jgi:predicted nucleic acid-binding protein